MSKSPNFAKRYRSLSDYQSRRVYGMEERGLTVMIKRVGVIAAAPSIHLERDIDDHAKICPHVHVRKEGGKDIPRVPIFGKDIKVNQDFSEHQQAPSNENRKALERSRSKSKHRDSRYRSISKERSSSRNSRNRGRSRSREKTRRKNRSRSASRHRSGERRSRSRSVSPRNRHNSRRSRSYSSSRRRSNERRKRAVTPLKPGEYRPGHPDLRKRSSIRDSRSRSPRVPSRKDSRSKSPRNSPRRKSRSRSPRYSSRHAKSSTRRYSRGRSKSQSPRSTVSRPFRSSAEAPFMPMPGMEYGFYEGYPQFHPMQPYRSRVPMVPMYPPHMMMPRIPMNPMMHGMSFRTRWPVYNSLRDGNKASKPATNTSQKQESKVTVELVSDQQDISSSRQDNAVDNSLTEV